jgi:hypothetical protein
MKVIIVKHIRASLSDNYVNDAILYKVIQEDKTDFPLKVGKMIMSTFYPFLCGLEICDVKADDKLTLVYTLPDKTFQRKAKSPLDDFSKTLEFKLKVSMHTKNFGYTFKKPVEVDSLLKHLEAKEKDAREKSGFVLFKSAAERTIEDYKGGFSETMFKALKNYISSTLTVPGWLGSHARTFEGDRAIESGLKKMGLGVERIAKWIASTDSKVFGDFVAGSTPKVQVKLIQENMNRLFNMVLVYGAIDHKGTMADTIRIRDEFREMGILKEEKPLKYFDFNKGGE